MPTATASRKGIGGPKTPEGKRRVSLNALKHGLTAESPQASQFVAEQIGVEYESILEEMRAYYQPTDPVEELLVRRIARCSWRLMITEAMEDRVLARRGIQNTPGSSWERIILHERRIDIQLHRALAALAQKRHRERENAQNKLPEYPFASVIQARRERESVPSPTATPGDIMAHVERHRPTTEEVTRHAQEPHALPEMRRNHRPRQA